MIDLVPLGDSAFLARFDEERSARSWAAQVRRMGILGVVEVSVAYRSVAVFADPDVELNELERQLRGLELVLLNSLPGRLIRVPVLYDGEDLSEVASLLRMRVEEVVATHSEHLYEVFALGFQPGFPYAGYLPERLSGLPRRVPPRLKVPEGSVAIVGRQTAIYPGATPGGWHLIGRTPCCVVDPVKAFFPIEAGDRLHFVPIDVAEYQARLGEPLGQLGTG